MELVNGFDFKQQFKNIKESALTAIREAFPIDGKIHKIELNDAWVDEDLDPYHVQDQKEVKLKGGTWAVPIFASLSLIDKETGKTIDTVKKFRLFNLPSITSRFSYVIDGNEYQTINQLRLKSGVYTRIKANDQLETQFNLSRGANFKLILNQDTRLFYIQVSTSNVKMYPILKDLGVTDDEMEAAWGKELFEINRESSKGVMETEMMKLHEKLTRKEAKDKTEAIVGVSTYFSTKTEINPVMTKISVGNEYSKVEAHLLLDASKKILNVLRGNDQPDDRDSLISKEIHSLEDFIYERLHKNKDAINRAILRNIDKKEKVREIISLDTFNDPIKTLFTATSLASTTEQINPIDMASNQWKVTIMGEGGITNEQQITNQARSVHPTHLGFIDPFMTPESGSVGAALQLTMNATKDNKELKTSVVEVINGKVTNQRKYINPTEAFNSYLAFTDEYTLSSSGKFVPRGETVTAMHKGEVVHVDPAKINYILSSEKGILGLPANLVPFVNSDSGSRVLMADKQLGQALSLKYREAPLVQTYMSDGETFHQGVANAIDTTSAVGGTIKSVKDGVITVENDDGFYEHQIYHNFPLNQKTMMHEESVVAVGDKVKKGQRLTDTNYTKGGRLALGLNLLAAYIPIRGYSFEDSIVISETAAKKLTSEHIYRYTVRLDENTIVNLKKFQSYYPGVINSASTSKIDEDGIAKKGSLLEHGDTFATVLVKTELNPEDQVLAKISKALIQPYKNKSLTWDYDYKGLITDVVKSTKTIDIYIKTEEPAFIGDKLSGVHGNKGTIGLILPDNEMPHLKDGSPIDIALNPVGVPSRINPGQILETYASKIAKKTGKPYIVNNFVDKDYFNKVKTDAEKLGIHDVEQLIDPKTNQILGDVLVGHPYIIKLNHPTRKKFSTRSYGTGYTAEMSPSKGQGSGGRSMDYLTINGMLAHGAKQLLYETHQIKSEKNDEYWRALYLGQPLPAPKTTFIFDKFISYLKGTGINVVKNGDNLQLMPMTNDDIKKMTNGEIQNISIIRGKNLREEKGGLFDKEITGGHGGSNWSHIKLTEPVPNPIFENAVKSVIKINQKTYDGLVQGALFLNKDGSTTPEYSSGASTGGAAIKKLLSDVDVKARIKEIVSGLPKAKKSDLDKLNKELRYLKALDRLDKKPTDYVLDYIPIIPPKFRPIYSLPDGNTTVSPLNELYRSVKSISDKLKENQLVPEYDRKNLRRDLYKSVNALFGMGESLTKPGLRGTLLEIKGDNPKTGLFQERLVKRRQDLSGGTVITPDPSLGVDEVGLPEKMAWSIFKPFVIRNLVRSGFTPLEAQKSMESHSGPAKSALMNEMRTRPVLLNRAPTLHKFGIMAFMPQLVTGKSIKLPNLVVKGFNADFDGDTMSVHVPITEEGRQEALRMMPTKHLLNPGSRRLMIMPANETIVGLYLMTKEGKTLNKKYTDILSARDAIKKGEISVTDIVEIDGIKTSVGRYIFNEVLPKEIRDYNVQITGKELAKIMNKVNTDYKAMYGQIIDGIAHLGNDHSFYSGFSISMKDIQPLYKERDAIVNEAIKIVSDYKKKHSPNKKQLDEFTVNTYTDATKKIENTIKEKYQGKDNAVYNMIASGSRGSIWQARQIMAAPMLLVDSNGKTIASPVTKSYSEGLPTSQTFIQAFGARKGVMDRQLQTSLPGELSKMLVSSNMDNVVSMKDCGTHEGIEELLEDPDITDRFAADDVYAVVKYNDVITPAVVEKARKRNLKTIKVRSAIKCEAQNGVCAKCSGLDENGVEYTVGTNIGVISAQTISEPATQLIMKTFHTGGVAGAGGGITGAFDRLQQVLLMPENLPNKATLASIDGKVTDIKESPVGGYDVYIGTVMHHVPTHYTVKVKIGDEMKAGDVMSSGVIKPQELLQYKGINAVRDYLKGELYNLYKEDGPVRKGIIEQIIKTLTSLTEVDAPGKSNYIAGDVAPLNKIKTLNKKLSKADQIQHSPILKGINMFPTAYTSGEDADWMARMGYRYILDTLKDGASQGWNSSIHGYHPIPALVYSQEFGKGKDGKY